MSGLGDVFTSGLFCGVRGVLGRASHSQPFFCLLSAVDLRCCSSRPASECIRIAMIDDVSHARMTSWWHLVLSLRQSRGCHESIERWALSVRITDSFIIYLRPSRATFCLSACLSVTTVGTADTMVNGCSFPSDTMYMYNETGSLSGVRNSFSSTFCLVWVHSIVRCTCSRLML